MKKRIIKTISTVLILAFAAQDMVWANPEIFERGAASSAVQIPSMFQYIRSDTYEKMLEAKLEFVLSSISSLKDFDYRLTLPMEEQGIKIDLGFDRPYREGDNTVIPCFLTAPISVSQYEAVIGPDRSLKELRKPKSETKPATLSEPMREKREPGALGAAAADWPGFTPGDKQYTDEPANDPEQKDISTGPVKAVMPPFVKRIFKVLTFTSIAGIAVAILFAGGYLDWYVQIKGSIPPGAIFYWPAAMLDIITGVFICGTADAVGQYINHGKDIRVRQSLIMGLFGILQGVLTHMLLNIPDLLPVIHQGFIQELFRTGVVLPGGFIISLVWARATSFGRRILRVKDYSERKELKKTLDVMLFKFTIAPLVTYMIINKLAQPVRVVTTQIWDYIMTIFVSYLMHRRDSLLARHILKLLHIAPSVEKVEVPEDDLAIMVRKASYIEYYANFVDPQDIRYIAIPILRNIMRDEGPLVRVAAKRMLNNLRGRLKVPRFNMSPRSEAEGKKIEESLKIIRSVNTPVNIAWIIPMYKEERRLNPKSQYNPLGEDALRKKIAQALTLRKTNPLVQMRFYMVDDASPGYYSSANSVNKLWRKIQREYARNGVMFPPEPDMVKVIRLSPEEKKGKKGGAVLLGIQDALKDGWADYIGYTDLDISTDIRQAGLLLDPLLAGKAGTAIGSRWTKGAQQRNVPLSGRVSSKVYNWCVQLLIPPLRGISDTQRGFKLFSREAAGSILPHAKDKSFAFDTELLLLSKLKGFNIAEVPISWSDSAEASTLAMPTESLRMLRSLFVQRRHMFNAGLRKHGASNSGPWLDKPMNRPGQSGAVQIGDLPPSNGSSRNGSPQTRSGDDPGALGQGNAEAPLDEYLRGSLWPSIPGPLGPNIYFDERCINRSFKTLDLYNEFDISKEIERRVGESHGKPVKILLLGVGRGFEAFGMMQKYREKAEITATAKEDLLYRAPEELVERFQYYDISVTAEEAAEYIRALRSRYIKCDLDKGIPLREKYDLVIMGQNVGVYLYKKIFALEECLRVCAEDGVVYFDHDAVYIASGNKNISAGEYLKQLNDPRIMIFDVYGDRGKFINAKGFKSPQFTEIGIRKDGDKTVPFVYTYYKPLRPTESGTGDNAQLLEPPAEQAKLGILSSANWNAAAGLEPSSGQETAGPWPNQPLNGPGQFGAVEIGDLPPPDESPRDGAPQAVSPETANNLTSTIERSWHADALAALMTEPITNSELFSQLCDKGHSVSYAELVEFIRDSKAILSEDDVFKGTYEKWGEVFSIISKEDFEKKGRLLTEDEEIALGKLKYNGNRAAWKALICFNIRLIPHLRKTYIKLNPRMSILRDGNKLDSDVDIICFQALMRAAAKFNWRRDSRFSSYAGPAIYHALGRLWRNFSRRPQINVRSSGEDEEGYDDLLSMLRGKERIFRNGEENLCFSYFIRDILKAPEVNHRVLLNAIRLFKFDNGVKILIEDAIKRYCPGHLEKIIQMFMSYMRADENQIEMGRMLHTTRANVSRMVIRILKKLNKAGFLEELKEICEEAAENIIVEGIAEERPGRFRLDLRKGKKTFTVTYEWREPEAALCKDRAEKLTQKIIEASKQLALEGFRVTKCQIALVCGITDRTLRNYEKRSDAVSAAVRNALKSTARLPKRPVSGAAAPSGESANPTLLFKGKLHAHSSVALLHTAGKMEAEGARFSGEDEYWLKALGTGPEWSKEGVISVYQHVIDKLRELCGGELKGKRLLEIGCGDGRILRYLKEEFGMDVVGIEVSPVAIEMAKRHNGLDGKIFPPEESQKIAKQWADIILSIRFLEQLTAPEHIAKEALRESDRILKSGGLQLHFTSDAPYAKALSDIGYSGVRKEPAPVNGYFVYARKRATDVAAESLPRIAKPGETPPKSPLEPGSDLGKRWLKQSAEDQPKPVNRDGKPKKITPKQIKRGILIRRLIKKIEEHGKKPTFKRITDAIAELAGNSADIEPLTYTQVIRTLRANGIWLGGRLIDDKAR
ncbi:MAG: methyltransferase domain-containing protein, partial [Candidatus Omnitrophica bacterium]|nr:methyltransferase domain-containing protein [Candidatus Omnitrophota bacterium]